MGVGEIEEFNDMQKLVGYSAVKLKYVKQFSQYASLLLIYLNLLI